MQAADPLSPLELDFLWESHSAGELPYPLEVRSHGATMDERAELRRRTLGELAERGLLDQRGRLHPELADRLDVLARADASVDSMFIPDAGSGVVLALAAAAGGKGVLAVQADDGLRLDAVDPDGLASAVVSLLPRAQRGQERSVTVPVEQLMAGPGADFLQRRPEAELAARPGRGNGATRPGTDEERKALARLHAQSRLRGGQIGANSRSSFGEKSRSAVLSWFDTDGGRYMTQVSQGGDGRDWVTIAPADAPTLRHRVGEMLIGARRSAMAG
ncbi:ESX secretion-associated protein EspG [Haloechinothrix sp. YIM 98757]|uniref:ESX secretion-associated protein EspG n=1 Tax=Haloechinothrix aidingensis TaxID=2752311 RepID=A0A838AFF7_9PSEU|nr:ESX secretion-associated protein EspG [Haloechinothrix aidingensis]MBA0127877.1 ESX secretion-associated protein EspG [Haloechinothrix aidingensis]